MTLNYLKSRIRRSVGLPEKTALIPFMTYICHQVFLLSHIDTSVSCQQSSYLYMIHRFKTKRFDSLILENCDILFVHVKHSHYERTTSLTM